MSLNIESIRTVSHEIEQLCDSRITFHNHCLNELISAFFRCREKEEYSDYVGHVIDEIKEAISFYTKIKEIVKDIYIRFDEENEVFIYRIIDSIHFSFLIRFHCESLFYSSCQDVMTEQDKTTSMDFLKILLSCLMRESQSERDFYFEGMNLIKPYITLCQVEFSEALSQDFDRSIDETFSIDPKKYPEINREYISVIDALKTSALELKEYIKQKSSPMPAMDAMAIYYRHYRAFYDFFSLIAGYENIRLKIEANIPRSDLMADCSTLQIKAGRNQLLLKIERRLLTPNFIYLVEVFMLKLDKEYQALRDDVSNPPVVATSSLPSLASAPENRDSLPVMDKPLSTVPAQEDCLSLQYESSAINPEKPVEEILTDPVSHPSQAASSRSVSTKRATASSLFFAPEKEKSTQISPYSSSVLANLEAIYESKEHHQLHQSFDYHFVTTLITRLGGKITHCSGSARRFELGGKKMWLHEPHAKGHSQQKLNSAVMKSVVDFIESAGILDPRRSTKKKIPLTRSNIKKCARPLRLIKLVNLLITDISVRV